MHDWGVTPHEWDALAEDERARMMAYTNTALRMRAWESKVQADEMDKARRRNAARPRR